MGGLITPEMSAGLNLLIQPRVFIWVIIGLVVGFLTGVLPGFDAANAAALALPFSVGLPTESAVILMMGIYAGSQFAGSIPAILLNIPGSAGSAATALDGYPLARQGRAPLAIGVARMSSAIGGTVAGIAVILVIGPMAELALQFRSAEMALVAALGLLIVGSVLGRNPLKGIVSVLIGLLIAAMSASLRTGEPRFTMGFLELYDRVPFVPVIIGMFAFGEMFYLIAQRIGTISPPVELARSSATRVQRVIDTLKRMLADAVGGVRETLSYPRTLTRATAIGLGIGVIPGMGTAVANFVSHSAGRKRAREPEIYGDGAVEGIIASEACDNSVVAGTMVPTLALGVPGSGLAAVIIASLYLHGLQPGPRIMATNAPMVYASLFSLVISSMLILPLGILLAMPLAAVTRVKLAYLMPILFVLCVVGSYALRNSLFDAGLAIVFGLIALALRLTGFPIVPVVLGLVLGPILEANYFRALDVSIGSYSIFVESTIAKILMSMLVMTAVFAILRAVREAGTRTMMPSNR
jgi:putative tricarboxylic transport membrane protein